MYITLLLRWFHSNHSMFLNDLSLPSDLKERRAGERNLSLPPIGCKRKVQGTATLLWGAAEKERCSRVLQFVFTLTSPHSFFQRSLLGPTSGPDAIEDTKVQKKYSPHLLATIMKNKSISHVLGTGEKPQWTADLIDGGDREVFLEEVIFKPC